METTLDAAYLSDLFLAKLDGSLRGLRLRVARERVEELKREFEVARIANDVDLGRKIFADFQIADAEWKEILEEEKEDIRRVMAWIAEMKEES